MKQTMIDVEKFKKRSKICLVIFAIIAILTIGFLIVWISKKFVTIFLISIGVIIGILLFVIYLQVKRFIKEKTNVKD